MKKNWSTILLVLILVVGLSLLLYPSFSDYWNTLHQSKAIMQYDTIMSDMSTDDYSHLFEAAAEYNEQLHQLRFPLMYYDEVPGYYDLLDITGLGIMGYIDIGKIGIQLPIYHGTSEPVLQIAVGHVEGSSLPTGGPGTHCVLSAHRGLPTARLFTDLDEMDVGDTFTLTIIDRLLTYEVDQISIVEPNEVEPLYAVEGEDYCTLVTCTPYGINSHRLLVRGTRIENEKQYANVRVIADATIIDPVLVAPFVAAPMLLALLVALMLPKGKRRR